MKVKFLKSISEMRHTYAKGGEYSLPKNEAEYYIKIDFAESVKEPEPTRPLKTVRTRKKK